MSIKDISHNILAKAILAFCLSVFSSYSSAVLDSISVSDLLVREGNNANIQVTISPAAGADGQMILYEASAETADGDDYVIASNRIMIAAGSTSGLIEIAIPQNVDSGTALETFKVGVRADHILNSGFENGSAGFLVKEGFYKVEDKRGWDNPDPTHCVVGADDFGNKDWVCSYPYRFETNTVAAYGHAGTNKVLEIDAESQGYQDLVITPGVEYEVSLKATRRLHESTPSIVDTTIEILTQSGSDVIVSKTFTRNNTAWNLSEETMKIPASNTEANVRLQFSTTNTTTIGMIIDDLSVVRVNPLGAGDLASADAIATVGIIDSVVTAPQALISSPYTTNSSSFVVDFLFNESVSGFELSDIEVSNGIASNLIVSADPAVNSYQATITPAASPLENSNVITTLPSGSVAAVDNGEANSSASTTTIYDVVKPTVSITPKGFKVATPQTFTFNFSEPVAILTLAELVATNALLADFSKINNTTYSVTLDPVDSLVEGESVGVELVTNAVTDAAGNHNISTNLNSNFDQTLPLITVVGNDVVYSIQGLNYADSGANATDNIDSDIASKLVTENPVDINVIADYVITYNVTDAAGNIALEKTRTVKVVIDPIETIKSYASDQANPDPVIFDFELAGITGVTADNLSNINSKIASLSALQVDSKVKIQAIVDQVIADLAAAAAVVAAVDKIEAYAGSHSTPAPELADYSTAGITGVTAENLANVNAAIDAAEAAGADTVSEIQGIVDQVIADLAAAVAVVAAIDKIEAYAGSNANPNPAPEVTDYSTAGITGVTAENLTDVNAAIGAAEAIGVDAASEIQAIVDQVIAEHLALNELVEDLNGNVNGILMTANQLTDIRGVLGVNVDNISKYTAAFAAIPSPFPDINNPTVVEINAVIGAVNDGGPDTDKDGLPDAIDNDDDNDGMPDSSESVNDALDACVPDNHHDECDFDNDGIKNATDTDDDGDGVLDVNEPGQESNPNNDSDGDGISNTNEEKAGTNPEDGSDTPLDTDGDKVPDVLDTDDDNDGLLDIDETNEGRLIPDQDNDGICDGDLAITDLCTAGPDADPTTPDADGNGICDGVQAMPANDTFEGCMPNINLGVDTDGDETNDEVEGSSDRDGDLIPDYLDADGDGPAPAYGDSDNDGINDKDECGPELPCRDSDKDGIYDYLDTDSDNDGISDDEEADGIAGNGDEETTTPKDSDGNGTPDYRDEDSDNDGTKDSDEVNQPHDPANRKDSDEDGIPDVIDHDDGSDTGGSETGGGDSDNDGLTDKQECPSYPTNCPDTDGDGIADYLDNEHDSDADGISDSEEDPNTDGDNNPATNPRDTDDDGIPDYLDDDADNDGKKDQDERNDPYDENNPKDTDNDGIPDVVDADDSGTNDTGDSDNDGIPDDVECGSAPCRDTDGDGIPDYADTDSDNDTIIDGDEVGDTPSQPKDTDKDGIPDIADKVHGDEGEKGEKGEKGGDSDGDGVADSDECSRWPNCIDTDRDGIADYLDSDSSPVTVNSDPAPEENVGTIKTGVHGAGNMSLIWVFMLVVLVMTARCRSILILALPIMFSSQSVNSAWWDEMDLYAGAGYGQSYLSPGVGGTQYSIADHTQDAWKLSAGWDWNDHISIEGYYANLGSVELNPGGELGYRMLGGDAMLHHWARGGERVNGSIALYAKLGINHMTNNGEGVHYRSKNKGQLFGAVGAELYLPKKFSVRFEIDSYDTDASLFSLNIVKRFGFKSRTPSLPPLSVVEKKGQQEEQFIAMVDKLPTTAAGPKIIQLVPVVLDTDVDGLLDDEDQCPYTPATVSVNEFGCATYDGKIDDLIANVEFEVNSASLTEPSKIALNEIADMLLMSVAVNIEVQAHSDNTGSTIYNKKLSQKRAESVVKYLVLKKIARSRLDPQGYGEEKPIANNKTIAGRAENRRVEFILQSR